MARLIHRCGRVDPGLLLALALALIAALPFLTRPGLPRGTDAELHVFRAAELGYSLRAGDLYPRWAPDFYYGYGYPIFNYYAPLTYYLANVFDLWPGVDIVAGVKLVFILGLVSAALGAYLFVRDWIGPRSGVLAAALYVLSPYVFFVDPHMRGVLAESFSLGLFPLALWAYQRTLRGARRRWVVGAALLQAALIMTHNLLGVVLSAILVAFLVWELGGRWLRWKRRTATGDVSSAALRRALARAGLALALGIGLSAIFWVPMLVERGDVQLTLTGPGHFDFHNHFLSLGELLAPSPILDLGAVAPRFRFNLGWPQWLLALTALWPLVRSTPARRWRVAFFVCCALGLLGLMLPLSTPIWETVPGMAFLQFPWRLLGPAAAVLSLAAAAGYKEIARHTRWRVEILGLGVGLTLMLALPAMFPPLWPADFGPTDPLAMLAFERSGVAVGTTSTGDFLPSTVETQPHPEPAYLASYGAPDGVDKVNRATLKAGTKVQVVSHGPTHDRFYVQSDKPFVLRLFTFYFPGWRAKVDGQEVPIELGRPEGFITLEVPEGTHTVEVRLAATPARVAGTSLSLFSVVALGGIALWPVRRTPPGTERSERQRAGLSGTAALVSGGIILVFFVFKVGWVDRQHSWFRRTSPPGQVLGAQHLLADELPAGSGVDFGHHIQLLGYDLPRSQVRAGETLPLTLYWRATGPVPDNYQVFAHLTRPATHLWGQSDNLNPGDLPTTRWPSDQYVWDDHMLEVLPGTPPGEYQLTVGLYTLANGVRVPVFDAAGTPLGDTFTLPASVRVLRPRRPPDEETLALTDVIGFAYAGEITLLGAVLPDRCIELPGFLHLALLWRAEIEAPRDISVTVQLVADRGEVVAQVVTAPVDGRYPAPEWSAGEVVRDQYSLWLAKDFSDGTYELRVGLNERADWVSLGKVKVLGP